MRVEKILTIAANEKKSYTLGKGKFTGVMLQGGNLDGNLSVKYRTKDETLVVANRRNKEFVMALSDMEFGLMGNAGGAFGEDMDLWMTRVTNALSTIDSNETYMLSATGIQSAQPGFYNEREYGYLPIGHITLLDGELEISFEGTANSSLTIYGIHTGDESDNLLLYDETRDRDSYHSSVKKVLFQRGATGSDLHLVSNLDFQIEDSEGTYLCDVQGLFAASSIFSEVNAFQPRFVQLYESDDIVPEKIRVKATGAGLVDDDVIVIVKQYIPKVAEDAQLEQTKSLLKRVEALEKSNPEEAQRMQNTGLVPTKEEIKVAIEESE